MTGLAMLRGNTTQERPKSKLGSESRYMKSPLYRVSVYDELGVRRNPRPPLQCPSQFEFSLIVLVPPDWWASGSAGVYDKNRREEVLLPVFSVRRRCSEMVCFFGDGDDGSTWRWG
jgi:hypothetical protein